MSESHISAEVIRPPLQLVRLPVDKPQAAVAFLHARSDGVMDLIAHFWERLAQTPPLQRADLHLVVASPIESDNININIPQLDPARFSGAMLYVPKAHRADVLALDAPTAAAFAAYISHRGPSAAKSEPAPAPPPANAPGAAPLPLTDLSATTSKGNTTNTPPQQTEVPADIVPAAKNNSTSPGGGGTTSSNGKVPIDFLTGHAEGISWMVPLLLPVVHKRTPARQLVNVVMQLPDTVSCSQDANVRVATEADLPTLNRWRRNYKEERGILFDADLDAWVDTGKVFVYENEKQIVACAKFDLELSRLIEIGGVYTFPEFRKRGFGGKIVSDLVCKIRMAGKTPTLQVDESNTPALKMYESAGWKQMGRLARVWLTG